MEPANLRDSLLAAARLDFAAFYMSAPPRDVAAFDALVVARAALAIAIYQPRTSLPDYVRTELERATHGNEILFTELREEVRRSATFCALADAVQVAIERTLFEVNPPLFS